MKDKSLKKRANKTRKTREVVIDDDYVHKETRTQAIERLENSIKIKEEPLLKVAQKELSVVKRNSAARSEYQHILNLVTKIKEVTERYNREIEQAKAPPKPQQPPPLFDDSEGKILDQVLKLMVQKEAEISEIVNEAAPHLQRLKEIEKETYPAVIHPNQFIERIQDVSTRLERIRENYLLKEAMALKSPLSAQMVAKLNTILGDINWIVGEDYRKIIDAYSKNPNNIKTEHYALLVAAQYNLDKLEGSFNEIFNAFDDKIDYELKVKETSEQAQIVADTIWNISSVYGHDLVSGLKRQLSEEYRGFRETDFLVSVDKPLGSKKDLENKVLEVRSAYHAVVSTISALQAEYSKEKDNIHYLAERGRVFKALSAVYEGQWKPEDFTRLDHILTHQVGKLDERCASQLRDLVFKKEQGNLAAIEKATALDCLDTFKRQFPELWLDSTKGKTGIKVKNEEYILSEKEASFAMGYIKAREKILDAVENGDQDGENYQLILEDLNQSKAALVHFIQQQNDMDFLREQVSGLRGKVSEKVTSFKLNLLNPAPIPTLHQKLSEAYIQLMGRVQLMDEQIQPNNKSEIEKKLKGCNETYDALNYLQTVFLKQQEEIDQLVQTLNNFMGKVSDEIQTISEEEGSNDPRVPILNSINTAITQQIDKTHTLGAKLNALFPKELHMSNLEQCAEQLQAFPDIIQKERVTALKQMTACVDDKVLERLTLAKRNTLQAFFFKLIRPLWLLINKEKKEIKPGFFITNTELKLKSIRDSLRSDDENKENDEKSNSTKPDFK